MDKTILLYTTGCPSCNNLKLMLNKAGIKYIEKTDVEEMLALGFTKTPMLCVDGVNMEYADAKEWVLSNSKGEDK